MIDKKGQLGQILSSSVTIIIVLIIVLIFVFLSGLLFSFNSGEKGPGEEFNLDGANSRILMELFLGEEIVNGEQAFTIREALALASTSSNVEVIESIKSKFLQKYSCGNNVLLLTGLDNNLLESSGRTVFQYIIFIDLLGQEKEELKKIINPSGLAMTNAEFEQAIFAYQDSLDEYGYTTRVIGEKKDLKISVKGDYRC